MVERILLIEYFMFLAVDRLFMFFYGFKDLLARLVYVGNFHCFNTIINVKKNKK